MTLSTDIYLYTTLSAESVYNRVNEILGIPTKRRWSLDNLGEKYTWYPDGLWQYANDLGQGFPAIVSVTFRKDEALLAEGMSKCTESCEEEGDEGYSYHPHRPAHNIKVNLDTAYGFNECGLGCADLHAYVITSLHEWFHGNGDFHWRNEFSGEIFYCLDGLSKFAESGDVAADWFNNTVKPLFEANFTSR